MTKEDLENETIGWQHSYYYESYGRSRNSILSYGDWDMCLGNELFGKVVTHIKSEKVVLVRDVLELCKPPEERVPGDVLCPDCSEKFGDCTCPRVECDAYGCTMPRNPNALMCDSCHQDMREVSGCFK